MNLKPFYFAFCLSFFGYSQEIPIITKKSIYATKNNENININGVFDELVWNNVKKAENFVTYQPDNGKPENPNLKSEVKIIYDDDAIYIAATLYDNEPDKILKQITERDEESVSDLFGVYINGNNDGQQDFRFFVTAAGGQLDCNATELNGEDYTWNAIWSSAVKITDLGWQVEIKIPYAAIRFPKASVQEWGINFTREIRRLRHTYTWNPVSNTAGTVFQQAGILKGIENIQTPVRLFLIPYSSFYINSFANQKPKGTLKGGLDLKYGINDAFTLDAVLVPDFGQTKFDDQILNLGPFEQVFNENRPFFTEGTDLFSKGDLLYTRRIGAAPQFIPETANNEELKNIPTTTNLLNALKVSGRNSDGLGIGFLNVITEKTIATLFNTDTNTSKEVVVSPLTNYNVTVFDQRFNQNSSVTFINTNVTRNGNYRDANVTGLVYNLNNKSNSYNVSGNTNLSSIYGDNTKNGVYSYLSIGETTGNFRYALNTEYVSKDYDNNDLGINFRTNYYSLNTNSSYRLLKSTDKLNGFRVNLNTFAEFNNNTNELQNQNFNVNFNLTTKKNHAAGMSFDVRAFDVYDYYNPRAEGRFVIFPKSYSTSGFISSNYNNPFAFDVNLSLGKAATKNWWFYGIAISPRYRFNDKFSLIYETSVNKEYNDLGRVARDNNVIVFAKRDNYTIENSLQGKYAISSNMNFNLNVRHYLATSTNNAYLKLLDNGLVEAYNYSGNRDSSFNSWNADLSYSWWFAPGSQMSVLYRSNAAIFDTIVNQKLTQGIKNVLNQETLNNTFSISLRYFIDYNQAKNWL